MLVLWSPCDWRERVRLRLATSLYDFGRLHGARCVFFLSRAIAHFEWLFFRNKKKSSGNFRFWMLLFFLLLFVNDINYVYSKWSFCTTLTTITHQVSLSFAYIHTPSLVHSIQLRFVALLSHESEIKLVVAQWRTFAILYEENKLQRAVRHMHRDSGRHETKINFHSFFFTRFANRIIIIAFWVSSASLRRPLLLPPRHETTIRQERRECGIETGRRREKKKAPTWIYQVENGFANVFLHRFHSFVIYRECEQ